MSGRERVIAFLIFWALIVAIPARAESPPSLDVFVKSGEKNKKVSSMSSEGEWKWVHVNAEVQVLAAEFHVKVPATLKIKVIETENASAKIEMTSGGFTLTTSALTTVVRVQTRGDKELTMEFRLTAREWPRRQEGCESQDLHLKNYKKEPPFFTAIRCVKSDDGVSIQLTLPEEVRIEKSSVVEDQGKGEAWKVYRLGDIGAATGNLGIFKLGYGGQSYLMTLLSKRDERKKSEFENGFLKVGAGYASLSAKGGAASATEAKPIILLQSAPVFLWGDIYVGLDLATAVTLSESTDSITYRQVAPFAHWRISSSPVWKVAILGDYSIASGRHSGTSLGYDVNQLGLGIRIDKKDFVMPNWVGSFSAKTMGVGSDVIDSHVFVDFNVYRTRKKMPRWGFGLQYQALSIVDSQNQVNDFGHTGAYGLYVF